MYLSVRVRGRCFEGGVCEAGFARRIEQCACAVLLLAAVAASAQVLVIDTNGHPVANGQGANVDRRFAQIEPTHIDLPKSQLDPKTRLELIRFLMADQGFAMRPFPRGHKGLTLVANGKLEPAGEAYVSMVTSEGLCAKPGDRLVISDVKIEHEKIILMLNGGPDAKHRFLRHIEVGGGVAMTPVVQDDGQQATGARLTLAFKERIPELTGRQVESLLAPLISFEVKTPIQAFTDTLPPRLKAAILDHNVLVGMSTDMVLFSKGKPESKVREMEGQMPFEEWIYGKPPDEVDFVRINGNRVIRVEVARAGKPPQIFTQDEVEGLMRTDGTPVVAEANTRTVAMGDVQRDPDTQAPAAPPSLRNPGEKLPADDQKDSRTGVMKPVQFPKQAPDDHPVAHQGETPGTAPDKTASSADASQTSAPSTTPAATTPDKPAAPAETSQTSAPGTPPD